MKYKLNIFLISFALLLLEGIVPSTAQTARISKNRVGLVLGGGLAVYNGNLTSAVHDIVPMPNVLLGITYRCTPSFSLRSEVNLFQLQGEKNKRNSKGSFKSYNSEFSITAIYDIFRLRKTYIYRAPYTPYLFAGIGMMTYSAESENTVNMDMTMQNASYTPVIPLGLGVKIKSTKFLDVALEVGFRKTFSDKLDNAWDGANDKYLSFQELTSNSGDAPTRISSTDNYFFTQVKVIYSPNRFVKKDIKSVKGLSKHELRKIKSVSNKISKSKKLLVSR